MADKKISILITEDDSFLQNIYKTKLSHAGFEVRTASNGDEAIDQLKKKKPDMMLLDIMMPGKNGFDVLEIIRNDATLKDTPVIILSNLGEQADVEKGLSLGAKDYIVKAEIEIEQVVEKINKYVKK